MSRVKIKQNWIAVGGVLFLVYVVIILSGVVWKNYQVGKQVSALKLQIQGLQQSNQDLHNQILYYQTDSYKERFAREKLDLQKPGEKVVIIPKDNTKTTVTAETTQKPEANWRKWWNFFFNPTS